MVTAKSRLYIAVLLTLLLSSCKHGSRKIEKVDTSECSTIIDMQALENNIWLFSVKKTFVIKDHLPIVELDLQKNSPDNEPGKDNLILTFRIDSTICINDNSLITLNFADSSKIELQNHFGNDCDGYLQATLQYADISNPDKKTSEYFTKIRNSKIQSITIETHSGTRNYLLSDIEATNLLHLITCLHKAE
jgi:hypothetical protein